MLPETKDSERIIEDGRELPLLCRLSLNEETITVRIYATYDLARAKILNSRHA